MKNLNKVLQHRNVDKESQTMSELFLNSYQGDTSIDGVIETVKDAERSSASYCNVTTVGFVNHLTSVVPVLSEAFSDSVWLYVKLKRVFFSSKLDNDVFVSGVELGRGKYKAFVTFTNSELEMEGDIKETPIPRFMASSIDNEFFKTTSMGGLSPDSLMQVTLDLAAVDGVTYKGINVDDHGYLHLIYTHQEIGTIVVSFALESYKIRDYTGE